MRAHLGLLIVLSGCSSEHVDDRSLPGASIEHDAVVVHAPLGSASVSLAAIGRPGAMEEVTRSATVWAGDEVRFERRDGVVEWWRDTPEGLEQGVTIDHAFVGTGPLVLEMSTGALSPAGADDVALVRPDGTRVARYVGLAAVDARGQRLPAHMAAHDGRIRIEVEDDRAAYPIVVDPLVVTEVATLPRPTTSGPYAEVAAVSHDALVAVLGSNGSTTSSAITWSRSGTTWTADAVALGGSGHGPPALAADGARLVFGARVYLRGTGAWTSESTLDVSGLGLTDAATNVRGAALSADGAWAALGAENGTPGGLSNAGRARVYARTGSTWTVSATLADSTPAVNDQFGSALALNRDGSRLLVGAPSRDAAVADVGQVVSFVRSGATWTQESRWVAPVASGGCGQGVAIDAAGDRAVVQCTTRLYILARSGTTWSVEHGPVTVSTAAVSVSIDASGSRVVAGDDRGPRRVPIHLFVRSGTAWTEQTGVTVPDSAASGTSRSSPAISGNGAWLIGGAPDEDAGGGVFGGAHVFTVLQMDGTACTFDAACVSGRCVDGVCCNTTCAEDCEACSVAAGGAVDGTCGPLTAAAPVETCRPSAGVCDVPEDCRAGVSGCPGDVVATPSVICRPADPSHGCDAPETCNGAGVACPPDVPLAAAAPCGALRGACDVADTCDGIGFDCVDRHAAAGVVCRPVAGLCDVAESCDGASAACPSDEVRARGEVCGGPGSCREPAACDGTAATCPAIGALRPAGFECAPQLRDAVTGLPLPCDVPDLCDGASELCMPQFAPSGTACGDDGTGGVCDAADVCSGTSADCDARFLSGVECRASGGACDPAEVCLGDAVDCPPDQLSPAATVCRASTGSCDPAESCDGVAASCPADQRTCADGGTDDAGDAGGSVAPVTGCGCHAASRGSSAPLGLALLLALVLRRRQA